jgi:RNA polymerase sigma-70 factor (ECF subfamily)
MEHSPAWPGTRDTTFDEAATIFIAQSDPAAFSGLYTRYLAPIYRYLRVHTPNPDDAEDLTQRVFLHAFKALPTYRQKGVPFSAWLFRIARNLLIDQDRQRRPSVSLTQLPHWLVPHAEGDVEANVLRHETLGRLAELVADLPADKRELLALRFAARLTAPEIAAVVGKSETAVQKQLERTIQILRAKYAETGELL